MIEDILGVYFFFGANKKELVIRIINMIDMILYCGPKYIKTK